MKALELLKNQEMIFVEDNNTSKKVKALITSFNRLSSAMNDRIEEMNKFLDDQVNGELSTKIKTAKTLAKFFAGNKHLRVEAVLEGYRAQENNKINEYYALKTQLLDVLHNLVKESSKEAVLSSFDVFDDEFKECEVGHEVIILKNRNISVLETLISELDQALIISGTFESVEEQEPHYDSSILTRNIELCTRKNNEVYGAKQSKYNKIELIINRLAEAGKNAVAFFTYKDKLLEIGCSPKGVKDYENELTKAYIPVKKALQKEFKIDLEEICNVAVNEDLYQEVNIDSPEAESFHTEPTLEEPTPATDEETSTTSAEDDEEVKTISQLFTASVDVNPAPAPAEDIVNPRKKSKSLPHKLESLTSKVTSLIDNDKKKNPFD